MKISRIPNFGSFGVFVDDVDMDVMSEEQWMELGQLFVKELVVIFRNINISKTQYLDWMPKWGPLKSNIRMGFYKKYGRDFDARDPATWTMLEETDRRWLETRSNQLEDSGDGRFLSRVYGRKDASGVPLGYFSHGEVHWHANESSSLTFAPGVSLLGWEAMENSATCFVQTVDLYEQSSKAFQSELDEMVLVHRYVPGNMNENEFTDPNLALHMKMAFCPIDDTETPLVITAPNGRKGLRYTVNSRVHIKGMTDQQAQSVFDELDRLVFDNKWVYNHWYQQDRRDLCCFDNSVTLHKRIGGHEDRKAFRQQFDLSPCIDSPWRPWQHMPEVEKLYNEEISQLINLSGGDLKDRFKIPD
jgi:alpha-ketoglutarate-dependent taurine dioxygenase